MTNIKGLDPFPRLDYAAVPPSQRAALEDIRRAGNAVRWARRNGRPVAAFQLTFRRACDRLDRIVEQEEHDRSNPGLF